MPSCGKTTVGKIIAEATGKQFIDCDKEIEEKAGVPIAEFFAKYGEEKFREMQLTMKRLKLGK